MHVVLAKLSKELIEMPDPQNEIELPTQLPYKQLLIEQGTHLGSLDDVEIRSKSWSSIGRCKTRDNYP